MKAKLRTMLLSCLALLLVLGMTSVACAYDVSFSDVPEDSWFYTDVMTLAESGVIGGYPDGTYRPTKKVTTGEALKMILLAAGYPEPEPAASHWARGYLNFAIEQGFLTRYEDACTARSGRRRASRRPASSSFTALPSISDGMTNSRVF